MSVTPDDVRRIADLARVGVPEERIGALVHELNGILAHMEALRAADTREVDAAADTRAGMPLRPDEGPAVPLERDRSSMAPATRDGFFLVPRLATHDDAGGSA